MDEDDAVADARRFGDSLPAGEPDETDRAVAELLTVLGRKHSLALLATFAADAGPWRFDEIRQQLECSPDTLSTRLDEFEALGLLNRESFHENPPRVEYTTTEAAEELRPVFRHLYRWETTRD